MIILYIISWILCGSLALIIAGYLNKVKFCDRHGAELLFFIGPIGLLLAIIILVIYFLTPLINTKNNFFTFLINLGSGEK